MAEPAAIGYRIHTHGIFRSDVGIPSGARSNISSRGGYSMPIPIDSHAGGWLAPAGPSILDSGEIPIDLHSIDLEQPGIGSNP